MKREKKQQQQRRRRDRIKTITKRLSYNFREMALDFFSFRYVCVCVCLIIRKCTSKSIDDDTESLCMDIGIIHLLNSYSIGSICSLTSKIQRRQSKAFVASLDSHAIVSHDARIHQLCSLSKPNHAFVSMCTCCCESVSISIGHQSYN